MNFLSAVGIGIFLVIWVAILAVILFRRDGKIGTGNLVDTLLPVGAALVVWMWIMSMVVYSQ